MKVKNLVGNNENKVVNQFVIEDGGFTYFQSYDSLIVKTCETDDNERMIVLGHDWDYSRTTMKYLHKFLKDYCDLDVCAKDIRKMIADGSIVYDGDMK